jgi:hypothetical protein
VGDLQTLARQAFATVDAARNDPLARFTLRERFYLKYGGGGGDAGFGKSELAFLEWEIARGVLAPLDASNPGSRWWRDVNASLLFDTELATLIYEAGDKIAAPPGARRWLEYMRAPSEKSWYVAHNGSIVAAYLSQAAAAHAEGDGEQKFMNIVLYRVLFAEAMVAGVTFLGVLGKIMADPELPAVKLITDVKDFYPRHYPLTRQDVRNMTGKGNGLFDFVVRLFDEALILPEANRIYHHAAESLAIPELTLLVRSGRPCYPL